MELYLNTYGTYLHKKGEMFEVRIEETSKRISPKRISSIVISNAAQITTDAIQMALEYNIDIVFLDKYGTPYGRLWLPKLGSTTYIRRRLLEIYQNDTGLEFVKYWIGRKTDNQLKFLKEILKKRPHLQMGNKIEEIVRLKEQLVQIKDVLSKTAYRILGIEGNISRVYFQTLSALLPKKYNFHGRSSRPAKDPFNAFLNYGYGVLYSKIEKALIIAGLDPYIGLLHTDNYNKKSLVFDFIEPYRTLIDEPVFYLFSRRKIKNSYYDEIKNGVILNEEGKRFFIIELMESFDKKIRHKNRNMKNINQIKADAHAFANFLIGKRKDY
ncbi:MAG: CRISPR-associated endonuclease Cas1 [Candidatus Tenebribacter mawsonii]|nr:CRISPR-associated endonuclease Cas1 [Candidatus Tenebribacter mawsonii]